VEATVLASDVDVGDTILLPGADEPVLVLQVRMGHGGLIFTVAPADRDQPEHEQILKLTARVRVRQRGRDLAV
jgi:hypothetical protein